MVSGKKFRQSLRHSMPGAPKTDEHPPRVVPAFTIQSMQKNTVVAKPPKSGAYIPKQLKPTAFRKHYKRGDFPISMEMDAKGYKIGWKVSTHIKLLNPGMF